MLPSKFGVNWPFSSGEEAKNRFSRWRPSWISDQHNFSYFWSTSHPMLPSKFGVNWPFGSGEEVKNRFSRWRPWRPPWISDRHEFSYFWSTSHSDASYQVVESIGLSVREKKQKIDFQDSGQGSHLGFAIVMILAIFDLQVTLMLPTKYRVNWPWSVGVGF